MSAGGVIRYNSNRSRGSSDRVKSVYNTVTETMSRRQIDSTCRAIKDTKDGSMGGCAAFGFHIKFFY